eukprot:352696-Chlamydomonas_euryale.AAC.4
MAGASIGIGRACGDGRTRNTPPEGLAATTESGLRVHRGAIHDFSWRHGEFLGYLKLGAQPRRAVRMRGRYDWGHGGRLPGKFHTFPQFPCICMFIGRDFPAS